MIVIVVVVVVVVIVEKKIKVNSVNYESYGERDRRKIKLETKINKKKFEIDKRKNIEEELYSNMEEGGGRKDQ